METTTIIFLCGAILTLAGWLIVPRINASFSKKKDRVSAISEWRTEFVGFIAWFRTGFEREEGPAEYVALFEHSVPELRSLASKLPVYFPTKARDAILLIVCELCGLNDA